MITRLNEKTRANNKDKHETTHKNAFPAGVHKAATSRQDNIAKANMKHKYQKGPTKEAMSWKRQ